LRDRKQEYIHSKGFNIIAAGADEENLHEYEYISHDYAKLKAGIKYVEDAVIDLGTLRKVNKNYGDKAYILRAIEKADYSTLRDISSAFYNISGMYQNFCQYMALLYRYDWCVTVYQEKDGNTSKLLKDYSKVLQYLDHSEIKLVLDNIALKIMINGCYYGMLLDMGTRFAIQELPAEYCRSRFFSGTTPIVELNMAFFDMAFPVPQQRIRVLQAFPKDIQKAYILYKEGKLPGDYPGDKSGWYMLDAGVGIKFNFGGSDIPPNVNVIPYLIDLDDAQGLDRKKIKQKLLKILIQKMPIDKNGDLIFDVDEAKELHNTACQMLSRATGVDVLTTFADIDVADMADKNTATTTDDLQRVERTVFNNYGSSQNIFNAEGNIALEKSIINDEAKLRNLVYQFRSMLNRAVKKFNRPNHYNFTVSILETTIYNYKELSKMFKEHTDIGFSKFLPQVALGQSQSEIIASATFENNVLHLSEIMIPNMMSSTMNAQVLADKRAANKNSSGNEQKSAGRPEKENDQKSDKTIANRESMGKEG